MPSHQTFILYCANVRCPHSFPCDLVSCLLCDNHCPWAGRQRRETALPAVMHGGAHVAALSLLLPRPGHRHAFQRLQNIQQFPFSVHDEVARVRELYSASMNILVQLLGQTGNLGSAPSAMQAIEGRPFLLTNHFVSDAALQILCNLQYTTAMFGPPPREASPHFRGAQTR